MDGEESSAGGDTYLGLEVIERARGLSVQGFKGIPKQARGEVDGRWLELRTSYKDTGGSEDFNYEHKVEYKIKFRPSGPQWLELSTSRPLNLNLGRLFGKGKAKKSSMKVGGIYLTAADQAWLDDWLTSERTTALEELNEYRPLGLKIDKYQLTVERNGAPSRQDLELLVSIAKRLENQE